MANKFLVTLLLAIMINPNSYAWQRGDGLNKAGEKEINMIQFAHAPDMTLPPSVDLSKDMPPPGDQKAINSSVGWALGYCIKTYHEVKEAGISLIRSDGSLNLSATFSPNYIYNQLSKGRDEGCSYPAALKIIQSKGAGLWIDMPYDTNQSVSMPDSTTIERANKFRIGYYLQIKPNRLDIMKTYLANGYPIAVGVKISPRFKTIRNSGNNKVHWSLKEGEESTDFQAMVIVGYDERDRSFKLMNSYGTDWAHGGYCNIRYVDVVKHIIEAYVIKDGDNDMMDSREPSPMAGFDFKMNAPQEKKAEQRHKDDPILGNLILGGNFNIPGGAGKHFKIVVNIYEKNDAGRKGDPVKSVELNHANSKGNLVGLSKEYPLAANGIKNKWWIDIPLSAFKLQKGKPDMWGNFEGVKNKFIAEAILYVDNFSMRVSNPTPFILER